MRLYAELKGEGGAAGDGNLEDQSEGEGESVGFYRRQSRGEKEEDAEILGAIQFQMGWLLWPSGA